MTKTTEATEKTPIGLKCNIMSAEKNVAEQAIEEQRANGTQDSGGGALDV